MVESPAFAGGRTALGLDRLIVEVLALFEELFDIEPMVGGIDECTLRVLPKLLALEDSVSVEPVLLLELVLEFVDEKRADTPIFNGGMALAELNESTSVKEADDIEPGVEVAD